MKNDAFQQWTFCRTFKIRKGAIFHYLATTDNHHYRWRNVRSYFLIYPIFKNMNIII